MWLLFTCIFIYTSMYIGMWQSNDVVFVTQVSVATQLYILLHVYVLIFIMLALNYCSFFFYWIYHPIQWIHLISILAYIYSTEVLISTGLFKGIASPESFLILVICFGPLVFVISGEHIQDPQSVWFHYYPEQHSLQILGHPHMEACNGI